MSTADDPRPNGHPHPADGPPDAAAAVSTATAPPAQTTAVPPPTTAEPSGGVNGHAVNGTANGGPSTNGHLTNGTSDAPEPNGHAVNGSALDGHSPNGATAEDQSTDGAVPSSNGGPSTNGDDLPQIKEGALENKIEGVQNPEANGHKPPDQKPHHHSSDIKGLYAEGKEKVKDKTKPSGGFDTTPLPDAPPGYTVRFIFHRASNLPAADIGTRSSDPFIHATLRAAVPKRHKEDPDLVHRTETKRRTTEPVWNDEWVVANIPAAGFILKCRIYDEDWPDHDDRLGNVTVKVPYVGEDWEGYPQPGHEFVAKKRMGSKRAYFVKAITSHFDPRTDMSPRLWISMEVLGKSDPPYAQMCTIGPTSYFKHFSPMIGRLTGIKVNRDEEADARSDLFDEPQQDKDKGNKKTQKYDFQSNEMQLSGPVPPELYHRYVEFRPMIGLMFAKSGLRGRILNKALHKQHSRVYNFDSSTEYGVFKARSEEAALQFLKLVHFDEGGRIFTYVLTLDGVFRFTETGKEFSIDMLSKHTMHSDVETYIACSGEFFVRRLEKPDASDDPEPNEKTHPADDLSGGPPNGHPPHNPSYYQLFIDNDSGTYRPDKSILPKLKEFLQANFPGLGIVAMHCEDEELQKLKKEQVEAKKKEGRMVNMVLARSPSSSSLSSTESALQHMDEAGEDGPPVKSTTQKALDALEDPSSLKKMLKPGHHGDGHGGGESSTAH
ncbi:C2 domain-containing protein [Colletotrichum tofieldiae]|uniref:C2 domain-containing protein n=1 Tax=Colletotrichum tofieldiae TaxID=708197 RepID=A0A166P0E2_9PEZI|nr:C2 domain-containing protein [Colletotrichum tofieldiae]GKT62954.1 C2 domain-containing protein [Colletotrichum tofieldiae]GKT73030.1 C2 domain-containing protein [Colletotrichum tofieldiae]